MANRISVVVSQGQSANPAKRKLEEDVVGALLMEPGIDVTVIPHLYDLKPDGTGMLALQGIGGDMIVLSWLFARAAHWTLDRNGIRGRVGQSLLESNDDEDEESDEEIDAGDEGENEAKERVVDFRDMPDRTIYCLDLRKQNEVQAFVDEIKRIAQECSARVVNLMDWVQGDPKPGQMERFVQPINTTSLDANGRPSNQSGNGNGQVTDGGDTAVNRVEDTADRRWYPVIDFSRCTNCMECIDFCLFGVYGVDGAETILVEQPDNCRKGCPACSRVCPENAIIFPQHKTPAIAGSPEVAAGLKIDLSKLFGASDEGKSAMELAAEERDEQLVLAGRDTVGMAVGMPKRQQDRALEARDELDHLIDQLDDLDV